jgi:hypothetical protein
MLWVIIDGKIFLMYTNVALCNDYDPPHTPLEVVRYVCNEMNLILILYQCAHMPTIYVRILSHFLITSACMVKFLHAQLDHTSLVVVRICQLYLIL